MIFFYRKRRERTKEDIENQRLKLEEERKICIFYFLNKN